MTDLLPLAQLALPPGLPHHVYEEHNRRRKATAIAYNILIDHNGRITPSQLKRITSSDMDRAADRAGVHRPDSPHTRALIRALLRTYTTTPTPQPADRDEPTPRPETRYITAHTITHTTHHQPDHNSQPSSELAHALTNLIETIERTLR
ncbi:hypothetical protein ACH4PU_30895 [Streptomyces sp. NPDC021100]|uniref:hypothetical protein n=1 Tax=Streptomyces sp. NPDC021100 TaxID=3365114 RepID=UPI00379C29B5